MVPDRALVRCERIAAPMAHCALLLLAVAPLVVVVDANANIAGVASLAVIAGAYRSQKPASEGQGEVMSRADATKFPLIGSCVLFGAFLAFKFLPKELLDVVFGAYFAFLGTAAIASVLAPCAHRFLFFARDLRSHALFVVPKIKWINDEKWTCECTAAEAIATAFAAGVSYWYVTKKHWLANNAIGLAFSLQGMEYLTIDSVQIGSILLSGLFVYDIFWVFCTPVMVSVARSFDAPIKLLFPRVAASAIANAEKPFSMLGLGDIVIPGLYVAMILRMDAARAKAAAPPRVALTRSASKSAARAPKAATKGQGAPKYFPSVALGYVAGIVTTIVVMNVFNAAQPALLYIVPGVLGATLIRAALAREIPAVWAYCEGLEQAQIERDAAEDAKKIK